MLVVPSIEEYKPGDYYGISWGCGPDGEIVWLDPPQPGVILGPATVDDYLKCIREMGFRMRPEWTRENALRERPYYYFVSAD